ncbi:MAG TPA: tRNA 2-selenouridine(34) synthase MnmH [Firmicutes bacterium]|nr:tRNA 2-selenouridine(34) synthase MnmH [Bacillota bacterium]
MPGEISIEDAFGLQQPVFVDIRSPGEFSRGTIPGSINLPLLDDQEREIIGFIYRKDQQKARLEGLSLVSPKLPELAGRIKNISKLGTPILYCWRGGMRSKSLHTLLTEIMDFNLYRLRGGYQAYRRFILGQLKRYTLPMPLFVLNGLTGTGKTEILKLMEKQGLPVLDLEGLARHRGSAFGHLGLGKPRYQKDFDGLLWNHLQKFKASPYLLVEGEGKRIGSIHLPDFLYRAILEGNHILVTAPLEKRVERLLGEYTPQTEEEIEIVIKAIGSLKKNLGDKTAKQFISLARKKDFSELVTQLCQKYYDRLYKDARPENTPFILKIESVNPRGAALAIKNFIEGRL